MSSSPDRLPSERDVASFVHLHLDTVEVQDMHPHREGHWVYRVEGKPRPMLVINAPRTRKRGRRWFQVLAITSKGRDGSDRPRKDVIPVGRLFDDEHESFIEYEPKRLPENMLLSDGRQAPIVKQLDLITFSHLLKIVGFRLQNNFPHD